jgi:Flp pilus assembly protein TadG
MAWPALLARLKRDRSGIAAVEFALVLPILLTIWLGMEQFGEYASADARTLMAAQSVSDLISQLSTSDSNAFSDIASAAGQIIINSPTIAPNITVSAVAVTFDSSNNPQVPNASNGGWICPASGGPTVDSNYVQKAKGLGNAGQMAIIVNVQYIYKPAVTFNYLGPVILNALGGQTLSEYAYSRPRLANGLLPTPC